MTSVGFRCSTAVLGDRFARTVTSNGLVCDLKLNGNALGAKSISSIGGNLEGSLTGRPDPEREHSLRGWPIRTVGSLSLRQVQVPALKSHRKWMDDPSDFGARELLPQNMELRALVGGRGQSAPSWGPVAAMYSKHSDKRSECRVSKTLVTAYYAASDKCQDALLNRAVFGAESTTATEGRTFH